jgi:hypothetical protein
MRRFCQLVDPASPAYRPDYATILDPPPPSLGRQLANAGMAAGRVVAAVAAGRPVVAPSDVIAARVAVCDACPEWVGGRCRVCGCGGLKRHLSTERCPLGKWAD